MIKKILYLLPVALAFTGCYVPHISLSRQEQKFVDSLSASYYAEVHFQHDYKAVTDNKNDGTLWIEIKNAKQRALCDGDSITLRKIAVEVTQQLLTVVNHRQNYNLCEVVFFKSEFPDKRTENSLCEKHIKVAVKDLEVIQISRY